MITEGDKRMRILEPEKIKEESFKIIDKLLVDLNLPPGQKDVAKRVVHATADLNFAKGLIFHPQAVKAGLDGIMRGKNIVTDVKMVEAGIHAEELNRFGGKIICLLNDDDVARIAKEKGVTRATVSIKKAAPFMEGGIVVIGNAPTALFELCSLIKKGIAKPALVIGTPVGFVGAAESKRELTTLSIPFIANRGRKGGSSVAAAITNALLKMIEAKGK